MYQGRTVTKTSHLLIRYFLALLWAHPVLHVSRIRVNMNVPFWLSRIMCVYIYIYILLGIVLSFRSCWFRNMLTLPSWLVSTDFGTWFYEGLFCQFYPYFLAYVKVYLSTLLLLLLLLLLLSLSGNFIINSPSLFKLPSPLNYYILEIRRLSAFRCTVKRLITFITLYFTFVRVI